MKNICKFLKQEENVLICKMKNGQVDNSTYNNFCLKCRLIACPIYKYYLQEYEKLTSK